MANGGDDDVVHISTEDNDEFANSTEISAIEFAKMAGYGWTTTEEAISFYFVVFLSLLALVLVLSKFLHDRPRLASLLPEAGMTIIVGLIAGFIVFLISGGSDGSSATDVADDDVIEYDGENDNEDVGGDDDEDDDDVIEEAEEEVNEVAEGLLSFSPKVFFVALLPPIIFNSGYHLKRELFFRHMTPIVLFACVGTAVSAIVVAVMLQAVQSAGWTSAAFQPTFPELLTFGALISATDPVSTLAVFQAKRVDPHLFYLVFGESVLNDAVGLVLFNALSKFVGRENSVSRVAVALIAFTIDFLISFIGSLLLGLLSGALAAFLLKMVDLRHTGLLELSIFVLIMYAPFFWAEVMQLSGIVTILFTGIAARRYAAPNLSTKTLDDADALFRVTAHLAETSIFLELGLSVFGLTNAGGFDFAFILWAIAACLVGRAANVYPITYFFNRSVSRAEAKDQKPPITHRSSLSPMVEDDGSGGGVEMANRNHENGGIPSPPSLSPTSDTERQADAEVSTLSAGLPSSDSGTPVTETSAHLKDLKIRSNTAHMLWYSGLRGAVAYACAKTFPNDNGNRTAFVIVTMVIVLVTVFVLGTTTEATLNMLNIKMDVDEDRYMITQGHVLKSGVIGTCEHKYIYPCVLRNYGTAEAVRTESPPVGPTSKRKTRVPTKEPLHPEQQEEPPYIDESPAEENLRPRPTLGERGDSSMSYASHVELIEADHLNAVRPVGGGSDEPRALRKKSSLYDYGSRRRNE